MIGGGRIDASNMRLRSYSLALQPSCDKCLRFIPWYHTSHPYTSPTQIGFKAESVQHIINHDAPHEDSSTIREGNLSSNHASMTNWSVKHRRVSNKT
eukprot:3414087-Amphidinium_carterae.1